MESNEKKVGKKLEKLSPSTEAKQKNVSADSTLLVIRLLSGQFGDKYKTDTAFDFSDSVVKHDINLLAKEVTKFFEVGTSATQKQFQAKSIFNMLNEKSKSAIVPTHDKLSAYWLVTNNVISKQDF